MRLGIDLGTTRTLVAVEDRGNYPVIGFTSPEGDLLEHYPTVTAEVDGELVHGAAAEAAAQAGAPSLRSWKRLLAELGPEGRVTIGRIELPLLEVASAFLDALRRDLFTRSNLPNALADPLEAVVSVPANAHSTQRFLTLEAFRRAGFRVRAVLNEPSAAGLEYAHRHRSTITSRREHVVVYDLGGGTFDAALVRIAEGHHDVIATSGVSRLGGDDFDEVLLAMALEKAGPTEVTPVERAALLAECRAAKEAIHPNSRRLVLDLSALREAAPREPVVIDLGEYYERVRPLIERSIGVLEGVMNTEAAVAENEVAGIYVVGGASGLPAVPRTLRDRFGRRVHRSPHPAGATAIGLAIAAAAQDAPPVSERLTRHLGVFRERDTGARIWFDGILPKGMPLPNGGGPLSVVRTYRAAHNVGHFRFIECGELDGAGDPAGDITPHAELRFPFAPTLRDRPELDLVPVERLRGEGPMIEERYEIDAAGVVEITITDLDAGYAKSWVL